MQTFTQFLQNGKEEVAVEPEAVEPEAVEEGAIINIKASKKAEKQTTKSDDKTAEVEKPSNNFEEPYEVGKK